MGGVRPADEARRALRAARERETWGAAAEAEPGPSPSASTSPGADDARPREASSPGARPGDAAREALRRGATRGSGAGADTDAGAGSHAGAEAEAAPAPESGAGADPGAVRPPAPTAATGPDRSGDGASGGARPGDIAREALRAARSEARQARTDAENKGARSARRSASRAPTDSPAPRAGRGAQAQEVRDLLAGAFQLPDATSPPAGRPATTDARKGRHRAAHPDEPRQATQDPRPGHPTSTADPTPNHSPEPSGGAHTTPGSPLPEGMDVAGSAVSSALSGGVRRAPLEPRSAQSESEEWGVPSAGGVRKSMGSPGRDGELRRTFAAFAARVSDATAFAETWWGNAWVGALEKGALDAARLARGRAYAAKGHVDAITVTPGLVLAYVHGSRPRPYRVQIRLRTLDEADWDRFLDAAAERPGHIAALLDKEMPRSLADCGVDLLPGPGDLAPQCSCPDSGHPCKHAAALCYQTARLLDEDPFVLLLLRGRGERELLDALSRRNAARAARAAQEQDPAPLPGVRASDALARRTLPPLPAPLPVPTHPEQPPTYPGAPGGPDPFALDQLATDAAARAHALLTTGRDPVAELTLWQDAVRLAAARPGSGLTAATRGLYSSLASAAGRTPSDLARAVAAWRQGGFEGLTVLEEPWDPPAGRFDRARPLLLAADLPAFRPWRNRLTHPRGHAQLRLGHDGLWYAYESEPGQDDWWPRGTPDLDPVGALTGLGAPGDL
ncbi:SWIM zinc finger family protein [Streptomyces sp. NPDC048275]|uniref:SWIM zinc finger family protein n=1 Tax=Streptomyces sp. NPDC048275 TaxID=3155629 RepID=UPI0033D6A231